VERHFSEKAYLAKLIALFREAAGKHSPATGALARARTSRTVPSASANTARN
jgi:hypothetical protein